MQPCSAGASEAVSSRSPVTGSTSSPARLRRSLVGRTRALTRWPSASSARATAEPTKPVAPVTRAISVIRPRGDLPEARPVAALSSWRRHCRTGPATATEKAVTLPCCGRWSGAVCLDNSAGSAIWWPGPGPRGGSAAAPLFPNGPGRGKTGDHDRAGRPSHRRLSPACRHHFDRPGRRGAGGQQDLRPGELPGRVVAVAEAFAPACREFLPLRPRRRRHRRRPGPADRREAGPAGRDGRRADRAGAGGDHRDPRFDRRHRCRLGRLPRPAGRLPARFREPQLPQLGRPDRLLPLFGQPGRALPAAAARPGRIDLPGRRCAVHRAADPEPPAGLR